MINDPVLVVVSKLEPDNCLDDSSHRDGSLQNLFILLPRLVPTSLVEQQQIDDQWRKLPKLKGDIDISQILDVFWHKVKQIKEFCLVVIFMLNILALPNSNAECEGMFRHTIRGTMLAKQAITCQSVNCVNFKPTEVMLKLFDSSIYDKERAIGLDDSDSD